MFIFNYLNPLSDNSEAKETLKIGRNWESAGTPQKKKSNHYRIFPELAYIFGTQKQRNEDPPY